MNFTGIFVIKREVFNIPTSMGVITGKEGKVPPATELNPQNTAKSGKVLVPILTVLPLKEKINSFVAMVFKGLTTT